MPAAAPICSARSSEVASGRPIRKLRRDDVRMAYKNIDSYGVIGDLRTVALVGTDGSIDWCCLPRFDAPSVFGAILDDEKGGYFRIYSAAQSRTKQMYLPDTNILLT